MYFCLNCRMFGDPIVKHRDNCPGAIVVKLSTKQIGLSCDRCGYVHPDKSGALPHECLTSDCRGEYRIPVYEYPEELRRS